MPTLPAGFDGENTTAEISVHPNDRSVFASNRGHDSIAVFRITPDRSLTPAGIFASGGRTPRHFALTPDGAFLIAANQDSNSLVVFRVDVETGALEETAARVEVPSPLHVRMPR